jgi:O-antigen/teichoic acid export membrane protein
MEKTQSSAKKNYLYNLIYQILLIIIPVITAPYLSRVLNVSSIGIKSYSYAIVSYFVLLANFGFSLYSERAIAERRNDKKAQSQIFWEIMIDRLLITMLSFSILALLLLLGVFKDYTTIIWIYSATVISCAIDVSFVFSGNENFLALSLFGLSIKTISTVLIFLLVKSNADLWKYVTITALTPLAQFLAMIPFLKKYINFVNIKELNFKRHLLPSLRLFIPNIAVSIYLLLDKALIGAIVPGTTKRIIDGVETVVTNADVENGYYNEADTIVKMGTTLITSLSSVMMPKNSLLFAKNKQDEIKNNIYKASNFGFFLAMPMSVGLACVSKVFVPVFFGPGYEKTALLMIILSPVIVFMGLSSIFGGQYLIPTKKDKEYTISLILGAAVNVTLDAALIPFYWSVGAVIGTVVAELSITAFQLFLIRKDISFKKIIIQAWRYFLAAAIMAATIYPLYYFVFNSATVSNLLILVALGILVYFSVLAIAKDPLLFTEGSKLVSKLRRKPDNPTK